MEREFRINWPALVEEAVRRRHGLKLTQKNVAMLAKVSAPTVSRFEQNAKDIQLSTVLAILEVLGMTEARTLTFSSPEFRWDMDTETAVFWGEQNDKRVRCRISREALDDHFSERGKLKPEAAFSKYQADIESLARRKYLLGQLEKDGSVLVKTEDVSG